MPAEFAELLRRVRLGRGWTQLELAERARMSERAISDLERGVKVAPRMATVRQLIDALGLNEGEAAAFRRTATQPHAVAILDPASAGSSGLSYTTSQDTDKGSASVAPEANQAHPSRTPLFDIRYATRADGASTAYGVVGRGPVLLVPPGFISHLEWWSNAPGAAAYIHQLAEHRSVVLYDRHGCGLSDRHRTDFTLEDDMQDIEAVADAVGGVMDLLGSSFGSRPAIAYAARHPERVRRLVLCGSGGLRSPRPVAEMAANSLPQAHQADAADANAKRRAAMAQLRRADPELFVRAVAMQLYPSGIDEATFRAFVHHFRTAATPEMQDRLDGVTFDVAHLIPALTIPTLVLHRRGDQTAPFASGQELAQRISGARFIPLEGDAHFEWAGDTQSVVRPMLDFLLDRT